MSHNNSTPQSVLDAPVLTPQYAIQHEFPARRFRRNMVGRPGNLGNGQLQRVARKETRAERKARKKARRAGR